MDELAAWLWLSDMSDSLTGEAVAMIEKFGSALKVAEAQGADLAGLASTRFLEALRSTRRRYEGTLPVVLELMASGTDVVTLHDSRYPQSLRSIPNPPLVLFRRGSLRTFERAVAVIGTRSPTHCGFTVARKVAEALAQEGHCIVSGLARGTDTMAHVGALDGGGPTVAVLPGPITFLYPPENTALAEDVVRNGALVAENSPLVAMKGRPGQKYRWVTRNRITSGLAEALVIIEAGDTGGSMHQVRFAVEQKRPVFIMRPTNEAPTRLRRGFEEVLALGGTPFDSPQNLISLLKQPRSDQPPLEGFARDEPPV